MSVNKVSLIKLYINDKKSIPDISDFTGLSRTTIRYWLLKYNIPIRSRIEGIRNCPKDRFGSGLRGKKRILTDDHKKAIKKAAIKMWEKKAKGYTLKKDGYVEITRGKNKYKGQHRVIMEEYLGRELNTNEVVHHINGIKHDNRIENLKVMTNKEHNRLHAIKNQKRGVCYDISKESKSGEEHRNSILKESQVREILHSKDENKIIAAKYKVSLSTIKNIRSRRTWKHINI
jgi:hypothetical protein